MSTFFIKKAQIINDNIIITGEDAHHIKDVLRYKIGDNMFVCDEDAKKYETKVCEINSKEVVLQIKSVCPNSTESPLNITLFQGLPKQDKLEQIIQKCTEIGVNTIVPVQLERSIMKVNEKNSDKKLERWNKIAKEAAIQSGRQKIPDVFDVKNFKFIIENIEKYDIVLLPYENEEEVSIKESLHNIKNGNNIKNIAIIIGPEGGFSNDEVRALSECSNVQIVSLGKRILRTETAGIVTIAMLLYEFEL